MQIFAQQCQSCYIKQQQLLMLSLSGLATSDSFCMLQFDPATGLANIFYFDTVEKEDGTKLAVLIGEGKAAFSASHCFPVLLLCMQYLLSDPVTVKLPITAPMHDLPAREAQQDSCLFLQPNSISCHADILLLRDQCFMSPAL